MHHYVHKYAHLQVWYFIAAVQFLNDTGSAAESDGSISFTVISLVPSDIPFTVQVCTRESDPQSAEGLLTDYLTFLFHIYI